MAVFDTVSSLGVPHLGPQGVRFDFEIIDTALSPKVRLGFRALAADETRDVFSPTFWDARRWAYHPASLHLQGGATLWCSRLRGRGGCEVRSGHPMRGHMSTTAAAPSRNVNLAGALARIRMGAPRMVMVVTPPGAAVSRSPAPGRALAWEPPSADRRVPEPSTGWLQLGVAPNDPGVDRGDGRQMYVGRHRKRLNRPCRRWVWPAATDSVCRSRRLSERDSALEATQVRGRAVTQPEQMLADHRHAAAYWSAAATES